MYAFYPSFFLNGIAFSLMRLFTVLPETASLSTISLIQNSIISLNISNNKIDSAQVLEEFAKIAKDMRLEDKKASELGLTEEEYAFYSVLNQNDSTKMLEDQKMKELVHHIVE